MDEKIEQEGYSDDNWFKCSDIYEHENDEGEGYHSIEIQIRKTSWVEGDLETFKEKIKSICEDRL